MIRIISLLTFFFLFTFVESKAQGCVATRGMSSVCGGGMGSSINLKEGEFQIQSGFRYFESFRHFRGDHEEANRVAEGTEVINHSSFLDLTLNYGITDRIFVNTTIPFVYHTRSSMYEHGGNPPAPGLGERHKTTSNGLADIRVGIGYWLFDPLDNEYNYSITLGAKLPSGSYDYKDLFYNQGANRNVDIETVVDQSIQPGDGGTCLNIDIQGYHPINHEIGISSNVFYMANPKETNGIKTRTGTMEYSCPDQYGGRLGAFYNSMDGWNIYLGGRIEGVPSSDIIGGSAGFRRPGYAVSVEPGAGYFYKGFAAFLSAPIAMYRNRVQSYDDIQKTNAGVFTNGDAAFADYLISFGLSYRFGGSH